MPPEFAEKTFVHDEIAKSTKVTQNIIDALGQQLQQLGEIEPRLASAASEIAELESQIQALQVIVDSHKKTLGLHKGKLDLHDTKLGMIIEGNIRRLVALEKGDDWANGCSVDSLISLVEYVRVCAKQDADWSAHATDTLLDLVKKPVGFPLTWTRFDILISFTGSLGGSRPSD